MSAPAKEPPPDEALAALRKGALLLKHGRRGSPKVHFFRLVGTLPPALGGPPGGAAAEPLALAWRSAAGVVRAVPLAAVVGVAPGAASDAFRRRPPANGGATSLSLVWAEPGAAPDAPRRTLDLTCADAAQRALWLAGARLAAAAAAEAAAAPAPAGGAPAAAGGAPAQERSPGHLFVWGGLAAGPPPPPPPGGARPGSGSSLASAAAAPAPPAWPGSAAPAPAPGNAWLDAAAAALGRRHGALATARGAVMAWGEGRGGRLGVGRDVDAPAPVRVALDAGAAVQLACGDEWTAAVAGGGELLLWGRPPGGGGGAPLPAPARGALAGRRVALVAAGPFHAAAVAAGDLQLFTWGEGFGGRLGHGGHADRPAPAPVLALPAGARCLAVACGAYHTAAVFSLPPGHADADPAAADAAEAPAPPSPAAPRHRRGGSALGGGGRADADGARAHREGAGGALWTWGGVSPPLAYGGGGEARRDSNRGCLGQGPGALFAGAFLPRRATGPLGGGAVEVRAVAAGAHHTVALATDGRVFQAGATGARAPHGAAPPPWEGAASPEPVRGALAGVFVDAVAAGAHHVVAAGRPLDRRSGRPVVVVVGGGGGGAAPLPSSHAVSSSLVFTWGRGDEGALGTGRLDDAPAPAAVDSPLLRGRAVAGVAAGGANSAAVVLADPRRLDPEGQMTREAADAAARALLALAAPRPGGAASGGGGGGAAALRSASFASSGAGAAGLRRPSLARDSASSSALSFSFSVGGSVRSGDALLGGGGGRERSLAALVGPDPLPFVLPPRGAGGGAPPPPGGAARGHAARGGAPLPFIVTPGAAPRASGSGGGWAPGREPSSGGAGGATASAASARSASPPPRPAAAATPDSRGADGAGAELGRERAELEAQRAALAAWAAALAAREAALEARQAALAAGAGAGAGASPAASAAPSAPGSDAVGARARSPADGDGGEEWTESLPDEGVELTFSGGGLRRVRFRRGTHTRESAAAWYHANQARLAAWGARGRGGGGGGGGPAAAEGCAESQPEPLQEQGGGPPAAAVAPRASPPPAGAAARLGEFVAQRLRLGGGHSRAGTLSFDAAEMARLGEPASPAAACAASPFSSAARAATPAGGAPGPSPLSRRGSAAAEGGAPGTPRSARRALSLGSDGDGPRSHYLPASPTTRPPLEGEGEAPPGTPPSPAAAARAAAGLGERAGAGAEPPSPPAVASAGRQLSSRLRAAFGGGAAAKE